LRQKKMQLLRQKFIYLIGPFRDTTLVLELGSCLVKKSNVSMILAWWSYRPVPDILDPGSCLGLNRVWHRMTVSYPKVTEKKYISKR